MKNQSIDLDNLELSELLDMSLLLQVLEEEENVLNDFLKVGEDIV